MTDYEQLRKDNIKRNNALLMALDIPVLAPKTTDEDEGGDTKKRGRAKRGKPLALEG